VSVRLGDVSGVIHHGKAVLRAMRVGKTITVTEDTLAVIARDPERIRDLYQALTGLDDYINALSNSVIKDIP
jgi:hypothetical protein